MDKEQEKGKGIKEKSLFTSFSVCETTRKQLKAMRPKMRLRFYDALFDFGMDGIEPNFEGVDEVIWIPMRDFIIQSKQTDERWHQKQSNNGKQGGAPKNNQNARKHPKARSVSDEQTTHDNLPDEQTTQNNPEQPKQPIKEENIREETTTEEKRREEREEPDSKQAVETAFSLSEELHPLRKDLTTRILAHKKTWNESGASPPCKLITFPPLQIQDMMPTLNSYSDEDIDNAIGNYATILRDGNLDGKPCSSFVNFIIRWVEQYVDEAKPFLRATIPKRGVGVARHSEAFA